MQLRKKYGSLTVLLNIHGFETEIKHHETLDDLFNSFENSTIINKNIKPEKLMEINMSGTKTIMSDDIPNPYDELRILIKLVSNFFIFTNQVQDFTLESIEKEVEENTYIFFGSEVYQKDLRNITFTPTLRSKWRNPQIIQNLIEMS